MLNKITGTIKGKIIAIFILCFGFTGLLTIHYSFKILSLKKKLVLMDEYHELFEDILEVRRYEKNFMYFKEKSSLKEIMFYLDKTKRRVNKLHENIINIAGIEPFKAFMHNLKDYMKSIDRCLKENYEPDILKLRSLGTSMVDFTQNLITQKRARINKMLRQILILPLSYIGGMLLIIIFLFQLTAKNIIKRLEFIHKATEEVAKGNFTPISDSNKIKDEVSDLIAGFNKMAMELESRWKQLVESRKLASIGTFTSGIAHEINNPLNNISLTAESLLEEWDNLSEGETKEMILDIINQASRASEVVKNLLDFSRTETLQFNKLEMKDVIRRTINLIKNQIMIEGIKLDVSIPDNISPIMGNLRNLEQVFLNLLLNAIQAMRNGGSIFIRANNTDNGYVKVEVTDTGVGIKPDDLEKVFDPFYTTKPVGRGTGLGLSIVYGIVKRHGGYVEVQSKVNEGTTFSLYLPVFKEDKKEGN